MPTKILPKGKDQLTLKHMANQLRLDISYREIPLVLTCES